MKKIKILIIGGSGFIGKNLINRFSNKKNLKILSTYNKKKPTIIDKKVNYCKFDLEKNNNLNKLFIFDPDIIIFLAWNGIPDFSRKNSYDNFNNTIKFFSKIKSFKNCKSVIYSGTCWEVQKKNTNKKNKYFVEVKKKINLKLKKILKKSKINLVWLRIFYVYGPMQKKNSLIPYLFQTYKKNKSPILKKPREKNDYVHIFDVVDFIYFLIKKGNINKNINFNSGVKFSSNEINHLVKKIFMKKKNYKLNKKISHRGLTKIKRNISFKHKIDILNGIKLYYRYIKNKKILNDNYKNSI